MAPVTSGPATETLPDDPPKSRHPILPGLRTNMIVPKGRIFSGETLNMAQDMDCLHASSLEIGPKAIIFTEHGERDLGIRTRRAIPTASTSTKRDATEAHGNL